MAESGTTAEKKTNSARLRVGAVNYLNTKPLIENLEKYAPNIELILDVPSQLALDLHENRLDMALIPSIEYFRETGYTILPNSSISSFGPVMSVKILSKVPIAEIQTLEVDEGSRTSIALATILLKELFGIQPVQSPLPLHRDGLDSSTDAVLLIGDRAMRVPDGKFPYTLDLGYEWSRWTGNPFVFAFWAIAKDVVLDEETIKAFDRAKLDGKKCIPKIVQHESQRLGLDETQCRYYLEHVIRHEFGKQEMAGLKEFYRLAVDYGLALQGVSCEFYDCDRFAKSG